MDPYVAELLYDLGEDRARRLLEGLGQRAALHAFERSCAVRFALGLLRRRVGTNEIRARLMARYEVSERTAFRYFADALARHCHDRGDGGRTGVDDEGSELETVQKERT